MATIKAVKISTDSRASLVEIESTDFDALQSAVGGWVERVRFDSFDLWCNEDGKMIGLPVNSIATQILHEAFGPVDNIVGDVIYTGVPDSEGYRTSLSEEQINLLLIASMLHRSLVADAATK